MEFNASIDIGVQHPFSRKLTKKELKALFRNEIAQLIPTEYRNRILYICEATCGQTILSRNVPFRGGWIYPGRQLLIAEAKS